ncbi:uncharacterized protein EI90DRAFT_3022525 [Cantharellus anzutake]|uniref:uncharacterized protein n=1 Tax=Cantharellus anzutake TaxID=1750568 RepID=UPI001904E2B0|nr:uncharacterized protein EI90DRAFT_3022525 [Cantharellus anzutake]KAF8313924.1 hypothetical protein EI90DRAFT_3022525 [Cantharellus anzutake]
MKCGRKEPKHSKKKNITRDEDSGGKTGLPEDRTPSEPVDGEHDEQGPDALEERWPNLCAPPSYESRDVRVQEQGGLQAGERFRKQWFDTHTPSLRALQIISIDRSVEAALAYVVNQKPTGAVSNPGNYYSHLDQIAGNTSQEYSRVTPTIFLLCLLGFRSNLCLTHHIQASADVENDNRLGFLVLL